jgi:hypothetical protein
MQVEDRIAALEERTRALEAYVGFEPPRESVSAPPPRRETVSPPPRLMRSARDLEDAIGGRLLAWVGGLAVALGVIFLLAIAVSRGWIGEAERTILAGLVSGGLLTAGIWAHERRGGTQAAKAAVAAGIAGQFATALVAGSVYELVPPILAVLGALGVGMSATAIAIRWSAPGIAALGILGALVSPALLGALDGPAGIVLLLIATASATAVLVWQRWTWLAFAAHAVVTPQWLVFIFDGARTDLGIVAVLVAFGALAAAAAVAYQLRAGAQRVGVASVLQLAINALVLGVAGTWTLGFPDEWLAGLALAHLLLGAAARTITRPRDLSTAALGLGLIIGDVAVAQYLHGIPLVIVWAASGVLLAGLTRVATPGVERYATVAALGGQLLLAFAHGVVDGATSAGKVELAIAAAATFAAARLILDGRQVLDAAALAIVAYLSVLTLDDIALTAALAGEAIALMLVALRYRGEVVAWGGALAFAALAAGHAVAVLAPPDALVDGLAEPLAAAGGLLAAAAALAGASLVVPKGTLVTTARFGIAILLLYAASVELVTAFIGTPQQAQALLSGLWAVTGVATLLAGLLRDRPVLRQAALALLAVTVAKVFLYDLASLTSIYRVASFIALGLLLLAGAFAWQRIRPRPLEDLRRMPASLR